MLRKKLKLLRAGAVAAALLSSCGSYAFGTDEVLVIGALHALHEKEADFDFAALERIIRAAKPDILILEVRDEELRARAATPGRPEYPAIVWKLLPELKATAVAMEPSGDNFRTLSQRAADAYRTFERRDPAGAATLSRLEASVDAALLDHWRGPADAQDQRTADLTRTLSLAQASLIGPAYVAAQHDWDAHMIERARQTVRASPGKRILVLASYRNRAEIEAALAASAPDRVMPAEPWLRKLGPAEPFQAVTGARLEAPSNLYDGKIKMTDTNTTVAPTTATQAVHSGYISTSGVRYYYEERGEGAPLLLLHGGLSSMDAFVPILPSLGAGRRIITVDLQGHGRTGLGERPFDLTAMGDDMATLLRSLKLGPVDVLGYSMGAGVAFQLATRHPDMVRRLALVSAGLTTDAFHPEILQAQAGFGPEAAPMLMGTPIYKGYAAVAPDPSEFPRLLEAMGTVMRQHYDWTAEVGKLTMPVMLVYGDADMYRPESMIGFYKLLGGGLRDGGWQGEGMSRNRLAILPGLTHYNIIMSPDLVRTVRPFLDEK